MLPYAIAALLALMIIWAAAGLGRQQVCQQIWDQFVETPLSEGGCGGDMNQCPVEPTREFEQAFEACRETEGGGPQI